MIKLFINAYEVPIEIIKFPAGETGVRLNTKFEGKTFTLPCRVTFTVDFESNDDIFNLAQAVDAFKRCDMHYDGIGLVMPYFPYARQDRVCNKGESLSVKVIANIINSLEFDWVEIHDPHSDVTPALINNVAVKEQLDCIYRTMYEVQKTSPNVVLVAPDAGAVKKTFKIAQKYGLEMVTATKHRDTKTGQITDTTVDFNNCKAIFNQPDFLVVDDIIDGGRTFTELAKELKGITSGKLYLYATHGLFTKGLDVFDDLYDQIYCHNSRIKNDKRAFEC